MDRDNQRIDWLGLSLFKVFGILSVLGATCLPFVLSYGRIGAVAVLFEAIAVYLCLSNGWAYLINVPCRYG